MSIRREWIGIKAILFDLYGTLAYEAVSEESFRDKAHKQLVDYLNSLGYTVKLKELLRAYNENLERSLNEIKGTLNELDMMCVYWRTLKDLGINPTTTLIKKCLNIFYSIEVKCMKLYPDVIPTLVNLKRAGLRLAIVSNATLRFEYVVSYLGLYKYFDVLMASYKTTKVKPHPVLFMKALSHLGVKPEESIMIGDTYETDIITAKEIGLKAILIARKGHVELIKGLYRQRLVTPDVIISNLHELSELLTIKRRERA